MKVIAAVDNRNGLMFNHRRLSQDIEMRKDMKMYEPIYMNDYSYSLYNDCVECIVDEYFLDNDDYNLIENVSVKDYQNNIDEIILYKWNRNYPADFYLDIDLTLFSLIETIEFEGKSHHLTKEIYRRKDEKA
ncbi:MAG: hypothetical protein LUG12_08390 [Erysipelotrichaceae bacterium]|nr:hypothetical protein [Erysipelotrichaceae bacterium]